MTVMLRTIVGISAGIVIGLAAGYGVEALGASVRVGFATTAGVTFFAVSYLGSLGDFL